MEKKKSKFTIEKLAVAAQKGFVQLEENLTAKMDKLEARMDNLENEMVDSRIIIDRRLNSMEQKIEKGVDKMLTYADSMAKEFTHWKQENAMGAGIDQRQEEQLQDHEVRITELEKLRK